MYSDKIMFILCLLKNQNLILNWDRNVGKSKYSVTCILDYAINHPNTHNLIVGHDTGSFRVLLNKTIFCNHQRLLSIVK